MGRFDKVYKMDLSHRAIAVYCYLYERANERGECWPAVPTIANSPPWIYIHDGLLFKSM